MAKSWGEDAVGGLALVTKAAELKFRKSTIL